MYKSIFYDDKTKICHIWDDKEGHLEIPYKNYGYIKGVGPYQSLYGEQLEYIEGDDIFKHSRKDTYETDVNPEMRILIDNYLHEDEAPEHHTILNFDIEVETKTGIPDTDLAKNYITSIALTENVTNEYTIFILDLDDKLEYRKENKIEIIPVDTEKELLSKFIEKWNEIDPDIVTGWNIVYFDIPYIINRIRRVFSRETAAKLGKLDFIYKDKNYSDFRIPGVNIMDYLALYKHYTYKELPSYSLDNVSIYELGEGKIEYDGNLDDLFQTDIDKFIEYNLTDVKLVEKIDSKMKFIDLAISIAHIGHIPYEQVFMNSRTLDGAILTFLKRNNLVAPNKRKQVELKLLEPINIGDGVVVVDKIIPKHFPNKGVLSIQNGKIDQSEKYSYNGFKGNTIYLDKPAHKSRREAGRVKYFFEGAYVEDPVSGRYGWLYSIDLESLYPAIIRTGNISPETKVGKVLGWREIYFMSDIDKWVNSFEADEYYKFLENVDEIRVQIKDEIVKLSKQEFIDTIIDNQMNIMGNGAIYSSDNMGVIPSLLTEWFSKRKEYQSQMKEAYKSGDGKMGDFYNRYQMVQKVLLNSMYGVLGLTSFRFYDLDNAEAVTLTGQDVIKFSQDSVNRKYRHDYKDKDNYVIYSDTDSVSGKSIVHSWSLGSLTLDELWETLQTEDNKKYVLDSYERDGRQFIHTKNIKFPYHDEKYRTAEYGEVDYIERHFVNKRMFRVKTSLGQEVDVTEDHSVMVLDVLDPKKGMKQVRPSDLKVNDRVFVCNTTSSYATIVEIVDLGIKEGYVYDVGMKDNPHTFFANDILVHNSVYVMFPDELESDDLTDDMIEHSDKMATYINDRLVKFSKYHMNCDISHLNFKREKICQAGFWTTKKRYALRVRDDEGKLVDKISFTGLDVIRSSFPVKFKEFGENFLKAILYGKEVDELNSMVSTLVNEQLNDIPYNVLARNSSIKKLEDYKHDDYEYISQFLKGTPIAVKAAMAYNRLLKYFKVGYKYNPMNPIDKVKYVMLGKNPYNFEVLAFNNYNDPPEIQDILDKYADREQIFISELESKLKSYFKYLGEEYKSPFYSDTDDFF